MRNAEEASVELVRDSLTSHVFVTGSTGSGKSNTVFKLLEQVNVPFLVVEPAKGEYKDVFGGISDVRVLGTNPKITEILRINPFEFPKEIAVCEHIDRLVELFNVCWPMYAAMPAILKDAMINAYKSAGWDIEYSENAIDDHLFPTFTDLLEQIRLVLAKGRIAEYRPKLFFAIYPDLKLSIIKDGDGHYINSMKENIAKACGELSEIQVKKAMAFYLGVLFGLGRIESQTYSEAMEELKRYVSSHS